MCLKLIICYKKLFSLQTFRLHRPINSHAERIVKRILRSSGLFILRRVGQHGVLAELIKRFERSGSRASRMHGTSSEGKVLETTESQSPHRKSQRCTREKKNITLAAVVGIDKRWKDRARCYFLLSGRRSSISDCFTHPRRRLARWNNRSMNYAMPCRKCTRDSFLTWLILLYNIIFLNCPEIVLKNCSFLSCDVISAFSPLIFISPAHNEFESIVGVE